MEQKLDELNITQNKLSKITDNSGKIEVLTTDDIIELASIIREISINFNKKRIIELIKNKLFVLLFGYKFDTIDNITKEDENKCALLIKSFWHVKQTSFLERIKLLLIDHYSHIKLLEVGERNNTIKKNLSKYHFFCEIYEMMHVYFYLLKLTSTNKILFPQKILWSFVNADNPIEKSIRKYLFESEQEKKIVTDSYGEKIQLTMEEFQGILNKTYNFELMVEHINIFYSVNKIFEGIKSLDSNSDINISQIEAYIAYDFLINTNVSDYLK